MKLKIIRDFDDTKILEAIGEIHSEIRELKRLLGGDTVSTKNDTDAIASEIKEGNKTMRLILARLDEIENDIQDIRSTTWYSRLFCM